MGNGIYRLLAMATLLALVVTGCGGGSTVNVTPQNSIGGVFSAGNPVASGTVSIYAINADGSKGNLLTQVSTDSHGSYTALIGTYSGPILMEGSGSFVDPASGNVTTISPLAPLRAALPAANEIVTMAVTPLSELAVREAYRLGGGNLTAMAISQANDLISDLFKVEITTTQPATLSSASFAVASVAERDYALINAGLCQLGVPLETALATVSSGIHQPIMDAGTATTIINAVSTFMAVPQHQLTLGTLALSDANQTRIAYLGMTPIRIVIATNLFAGLPASISTISCDLSLSPTVLLEESAGVPLQSTVIASGVALYGLDSLTYSRDPLAQTLLSNLTITRNSPFGIGAFITIDAEVTAGTPRSDITANVVMNGIPAGIPTGIGNLSITAYGGSPTPYTPVETYLTAYVTYP